MNSQAIAQKVLQIAPLVLLARGAGFALIALIAWLFGAQAATDAFFITFAVAVVLQFIVASGVASVATPVMATLKTKGPEQLSDLCSSVALVASLLAATTAFLAYLGLEPLLERLQLLPALAAALALRRVANIPGQRRVRGNRRLGVAVGRLEAC